MKGGGRHHKTLGETAIQLTMNTVREDPYLGKGERILYRGREDEGEGLEEKVMEECLSLVLGSVHVAFEGASGGDVSPLDGPGQFLDFLLQLCLLVFKLKHHSS